MIFGLGKKFQEEWGLDNEAQAFFILRWQDLFDERTYDSWQVRTSNVQTIMAEMLVGLEMARLEPKSYASLGSLVDEAIEIAKRDLVIRTSFPTVCEMLDGLQRHYKDNTNANNRDLDCLERRTRIISGSLRKYPFFLTSMIKTRLLNPEKHFKKELYTLTMSHAVWLCSLGYSIPYLRNSWEQLTDVDEGEFKKRLTCFLGKLSGHLKNYRCLFPMRVSIGNLPDSTFEDVCFMNQASLSKSVASAELENFQKEYASNIMAQVECSAMDGTAARHSARLKLEECLAAMRLFHYEGNIEIQGAETLVVEQDSGSISVTKHDTTVLEYMRTPRDTPTRLNQLATVMSKLAEADARRLGAVMEYHRLALAAKTDEVRLVNLWVAVECLVRLPGKSIITNVTEYLPYTVATHHAQGLLKSLAIDFRASWRCQEAAILRNAVKDTTTSKRQIPLGDLVSWLSQNSDGEQVKCLYNDLATHNPLMTFRLNGLQQYFLKDRTTFSKSMKNYVRHIDWQLRRIYRVRNMVVHLGQHQKSAQLLVQHLHSYLILTLLNLIQDLRHNPEWGIMDALEFRKQIFESWAGAGNTLKALDTECFLYPAYLTAPRKSRYDNPLFGSQIEENG
jgi:hypothetical protein